MAEVTSIAIQDRNTPQNEVGAFGISVNYAVASGLASNGDRIKLLEFQRAGVVFAGGFAVDATLGAAATIQLRHMTADDATGTAITGATTAAGADRELLTRPIRFAAGDKLELLVGGGNILAAANVQLDLVVSHNPVLIASALD